MVEEKVIEGSFTVEPSKEAIYINTLSVPKSQDTEVVYDEHVAENTVNYKISYNAEQIGQPYFEENIEGEDGCQYFDLYTEWEDTNEVANLFDARDMVLSDLKKERLGLTRYNISKKSNSGSIRRTKRNWLSGIDRKKDV